MIGIIGAMEEENRILLENMAEKNRGNAFPPCFYKRENRKPGSGAGAIRYR